MAEHRDLSEFTSAYELLVRCAWCDALLGSKEPLGNRQVTSGICVACLDRLGFGQGGRAAGRRASGQGADTATPGEGARPCP